MRARAHGLRPVVWIGEAGVTAGALREIDRALDAHELVKIHAAIAGHAARSTLLDEVCAGLGAFPIQVIGKMLVAFRPRRTEPTAPDDRAARAGGSKKRARAPR